MSRKLDRLLDLLVLVGYSIAFPVKLAKRISGHEQYDRCVMYRAVREGYVSLIRSEGKRQVIRSLQLTEKGLDYIACRDPEAVALIYGRTDSIPKVYPSQVSRLLRLHAIAVGLVMARAAGAVIPPLKKPSLLLHIPPQSNQPANPEMVYYYSPFELRAAFEELDDRVMSKTSRLIGIIIRKNHCFCLYYAGKSRIFWQRVTEENHAYGIKALLQARGFQIDVLSQIVIGSRMSVAEKLCRSPRPGGDKYFVVSDFFDHCHFVTDDAAGDKLLPMIIHPTDYLDRSRQMLVRYQPPESGERMFDALEGTSGRAVFLEVGCDLLTLERLKQRRFGFLKEPIVLCCDFQSDTVAHILKDAAEVRSIPREIWQGNTRTYTDPDEAYLMNTGQSKPQLPGKQS